MYRNDPVATVRWLVAANGGALEQNRFRRTGGDTQ
jgi:hypothetical protein